MVTFVEVLFDAAAAVVTGAFAVLLPSVVLAAAVVRIIFEVVFKELIAGLFVSGTVVGTDFVVSIFFAASFKISIGCFPVRGTVVGLLEVNIELKRDPW